MDVQGLLGSSRAVFTFIIYYFPFMFASQVVSHADHVVSHVGFWPYKLIFQLEEFVYTCITKDDLLKIPR